MSAAAATRRSRVSALREVRDDVRRRRLDRLLEPRRQLRHRAGRTSRSCARWSRARSRRTSDRRSSRSSRQNLVEVVAHLNSPSSRSASRASPLRVRVFTVPSGMPRNWATSRCDSSPQYASSSTSRSLSGRSWTARCTRHAMYADSARSAGPGAPDASSGGSAKVGVASCAGAVDDRVPRDRVQPRSSGPAVRSVAPGRAPDRREGLLHRILGAAAVAEETQRQAQDRPSETAVKRVKGCAVTIGDPLEELSVRRPVLALVGRNGLRSRGGGGCLHVLIVSTHRCGAAVCVSPRSILPFSRCQVFVRVP